jgi:hypothetical protein
MKTAQEMVDDLKNRFGHSEGAEKLKAKLAMENNRPLTPEEKIKMQEYVQKINEIGNPDKFLKKEEKKEEK